MAEGTLFSLASRLLSLTASKSLERALPRGARDELEKIGRSIKIVQAVILDAEKRSGESDVMKNWIGRLRGLLYTVEDLIDEVAANDMMRRTIVNKVRLIFSNPSAYLTVKLKAIRKSLDEFCKDTARFNFVLHPYEEPRTGIRKGLGTGWLIDPDLVIGRNHEMKSILSSLFDVANAEENLSVIVIVGIGGMGKTTLAQLVYQTHEVQENFEARWWACVSNMFDEAEIIRSIFEPIVGEYCDGLNLSQLETRIRETSMNKKFLLVIDHLEVENDLLGQKLRSLLTSDNIRGNKIIVTTRSFNVARAIGGDRIHELNGLSSDESWNLFKRIAFTREQENDPAWINLGRKILRKCHDVPLAIKTIASLLYTKPSKEEWKSTLDFVQPGVSDGSIMDVLKLSYDHLPSDLKACFSYCSLFPKDHKSYKDNLIRLWIAQGFITPKNNETYEAAGDASFEELLRRCYFQVEEKGENGESTCYRMHGLMHDLALFVSKQESFVLTEGLDQFHQPNRHFIRHFSVGFMIDDSWHIPPPWPTCGQLRSFLFTCAGLLSQLALEQSLKSFKVLRVLDLQHQNLWEVPSSIGELIHLRYLNLSGNIFRTLPNSVTRLCLLHTLVISSCVLLESLPVGFTKLISLRHLVNDNCVRLRYMPPRFGKLTSLQHLSYFKVGKVISGVNSSRLDALGGLKLRGQLQIRFDNDIDNWDEDECWQLPTTLQVLEIRSYPGLRIPLWDQRRVDIPSLLPNLVRVHLYNSSTIKYLPPLRCLPYLKTLHLSGLNQLTYVEEELDEHESGQCAQLAAGYSMLFFPCLEELKLTELRRLIGWSRELEAVTTSRYIAAEDDEMPSFPLLSNLRIEKCPMLKSVPQSSCLRTLELHTTKEELIQHLLSTCSHSLETIAIRQCDSLNSFSGETLTSLRHLELSFCNEVKNLHLPLTQYNVLEELVIQSCPQLKLWELRKGGVDWDSLINLRVLSLDEIPDAEKLSIYLPNTLVLANDRLRRSCEKTTDVKILPMPRLGVGSSQSRLGAGSSQPA